MYRSYLTASLFLSLLLVSGGCAKKTIVEVAETPEPPAAETATQPPSSVSTATGSENKPPVVVAPIKSVNMGLKTILFEYDSVRLTANAQRLLQMNAEWLKGNLQGKATIEGHCDERGSDEYNLALGERRAAVGIVDHVRKGAALDCQLGRRGRARIGQAVLGLAR